MPRTLKLLIAYDGAGFHGWQRQAGVRTVQEACEDTLRRIVNEPVVLFGASRTDAGVHARGQVAHVHTSSTIAVERLERAVAHRLPGDVQLVRLSEAPAEFHAARDAACKLYRYRMHNHASRPIDAQIERFAWHMWYPLDDDRLSAAADRMIGAHDFAGFATQGSPRPNTVRRVRRVDVSRRGREVRIDVIGDGFLYNQVRNMVGTLVEVGRGHWPVERIDEILATGDRRLAGPTAPPHGLCLQWIQYPRIRWARDGDVRQ